MNILQKISGVILLTFLLIQNSYTSEAFDLIKEQSDKMLSFITSLDKKAKNREELIEKKSYELLVPHISFKSMTYLATGKSDFAKMSDEKQEELTEAFKGLLVKTYAKTMNKYTNEKILYDPFEAGKKKGRAVVKTNISQKNTVAIPVHYKLILKNNKWLIYDILVDGISLITSYRTTFKNEIKKHGVDGLIKNLREKASASNKKVE
jgi:phospholipid transport system substrate-binding protein